MAKKPILNTEKYEYSIGQKPKQSDHGDWHFHRVRSGGNHWYPNVSYAEALQKLEAENDTAGIEFEVLWNEVNPKRIKVR